MFLTALFVRCARQGAPLLEMPVGAGSPVAVAAPGAGRLLLRQGEVESRTFSLFAFRANTAVVSLNYFLTNCKS